MGTLQRDLGRRVRELRVRSGLTQEDLASKADLDGKYISAVEGGRCNLTLKNLERIAHALEVNPSRLFHAPKEKTPRLDVQDAVLLSLFKRSDRAARLHFIRLLRSLLRGKQKRK